MRVQERCTTHPRARTHARLPLRVPCCLAAAKSINGNRNFFWGMSTTSVKDVEGQAFNNDFFQAYENFREIRNSDVSGVCHRAPKVPARPVSRVTLTLPLLPPPPPPSCSRPWRLFPV